VLDALEGEAHRPREASTGAAFDEGIEEGHEAVARRPNGGLARSQGTTDQGDLESFGCQLATQFVVVGQGEQGRIHHRHRCGRRIHGAPALHGEIGPALITGGVKSVGDFIRFSS